jgi:hypothetical protein
MSVAFWLSISLLDMPAQPYNKLVCISRNAYQSFVSFDQYSWRHVKKIIILFGFFLLNGKMIKTMHVTT